MSPDHGDAEKAGEYDGIAMIAEWPPRFETRPDKGAQEKR